MDNIYELSSNFGNNEKCNFYILTHKPQGFHPVHNYAWEKDKIYHSTFVILMS